MRNATQDPNPFEYYQKILSSRNPEQLRTIAHIKRFMECVSGDPEFRESVKGKTKGLRQIAAKRGIDIDPLDLAPLFRPGFKTGLPTDELDDAPIAKMWNDWIVEKLAFRDLTRDLGAGDDNGTLYGKWRNRQIARCDSEIGTGNKSVIHSRLSFELSKGCSVRCWFCAFDAGPLEGVFPYNRENAGLWRGMLEAALEAFGPAARTGACYHATEPSDNPDYLKFIRDYRDVMGIVPQTTTAAPLRDPDWTRELLRLHVGKPGVPSRFSVLSLKDLRRLHETFSPEELLEIELILQMRTARICKSRAGRVRERKVTADASGAVPEVANYPGTIACITGVLVNMVDRSIQLISPCSATDKWPLGYKIHARGSFDSPDAFTEFISQVGETRMPGHLAGDDPLAFRPDLKHARTEDGFTLSSCFHRYSFRGEPFLVLLGDLIDKGDKTVGEVIGELVENNADIIVASSTIQDLFEKGLLDEDLVMAL